MSESAEASSVRLYIFSGARSSRWKLLQGFGMLRMALRNKGELSFVRAMGCGRGIGFSLLPDLSRYSVLATGTDEVLDRFEKSPAMEDMGARAQRLEIYDLLPLKGHGSWDGEDPFRPGEAPAPHSPMAVITRARIPLHGILEFIRHSHQVTAALASAAGRIFSIGVGEWPFVRQATFSVWSDAEAMTDFAYQNAKHRNAVGATRKRKLFSEELFWRFAIRGYTMRPLV